MKKLFAVTAVALAFASVGCGMLPSPSQGGWITLFDGSTIDTWNRVGDANWRLEGGLAVSDNGDGFLVTKDSYGDFEIRAEFWVDAHANSGIYIRCQDPAKLVATTCYEVNIFDERPDPLYGTGAIVYVSKVDPMPKAGGKWNVFEITAKGDHFVVKLNGVVTADAHDAKHARGVIGLQSAPGAVKGVNGVVKFRKVEIRPL